MTSFFYAVSYCHLSATLQTMSVTVANLQDSRALVRIFIALLRFSVDSPSYYEADDGFFLSMSRKFEKFWTFVTNSLNC